MTATTKCTPCFRPANITFFVCGHPLCEQHTKKFIGEQAASLSAKACHKLRAVIMRTLVVCAILIVATHCARATATPVLSTTAQYHLDLSLFQQL